MKKRYLFDILLPVSLLPVPGFAGAGLAGHAALAATQSGQKHEKLSTKANMEPWQSARYMTSFCYGKESSSHFPFAVFLPFVIPACLKRESNGFAFDFKNKKSLGSRLPPRGMTALRQRHNPWKSASATESNYQAKIDRLKEKTKKEAGEARIKEEAEGRALQARLDTAKLKLKKLEAASRKGLGKSQVRSGQGLGQSTLRI